MSPQPITFVTTSNHKATLAAQILGVPVLQKSIEVSALLEEPLEVAEYKLKKVRDQIKGPLMVEVTTLVFDALHGLPGAYTQPFYQKLGNQGLIDILAAYDDKHASVTSTIAYSEDQDAETHRFSDKVNGIIVEPRGDKGYAWDPIFQVHGSNLTFAEMPPDIKNKYSHLRRSLSRMNNFLQEKP